MRRILPALGLLIALAITLWLWSVRPLSETALTEKCQGICDELISCSFVLEKESCLTDCRVFLSAKAIRALAKAQSCQGFLDAAEASLPATPADDLTTHFRINAASNPADACAQAAAGNPENRWIHYFHLGTAVGKRHPEPSPQWREFAGCVPDNMKPNFFDGLADGAHLVSADPEALLAAVNEVVDPPYQKLFPFGMFLDFTIAHNADAFACEAFFRPFEQEYSREIRKGLSIGLVRLFRDDWESASEAIKRFGPSYQEECFEELGWQVGATVSKDAARANLAASDVPQQWRGVFYHGYVRSLEIPGGVNAVEKVIEKIPTEFWPQAYQALGWKVSVWYWDESVEDRRKRLSSLRNPQYADFALKKIENPLGDPHSQPRAPIGPPPFPSETNAPTTAGER